jgi:putative hydrolase of the HAD superfamily
LTTETGLSTTSPAAMAEATSWESNSIVTLWLQNGHYSAGQPLPVDTLLAAGLYCRHDSAEQGLPSMTWSVVFFDLDDTLYPPSSGVWPAIGERIQAYVMDRLRLTYDEATQLRRSYFEKYGTTLNGLWHLHAIDPADYLAFVHDIPLESMIRPDPDLRSMLHGLPQKRVVFTNATRDHAQRVLACLDVASEIDLIVDLFALEMANKPETIAYERALKLAEEADPHRCILADDLPRNLAPARAMGMTTVLVSPKPPDGAADLQIDRIADLTQALPDLTANDHR